MFHTLVISSLILILVGSYPAFGVSLPSWPPTTASMVHLAWIIVILWPWFYLLFREGVKRIRWVVFFGIVFQAILFLTLLLWLGNEKGLLSYTGHLFDLIFIVVVLEIIYLAFSPAYGHLSLSSIKSLKSMLVLIFVFLMGIVFLFLPIRGHHLLFQRSYPDIAYLSKLEIPDPLADYFQLPEIFYGVLIYSALVSLFAWPWVYVNFKKDVLHKGIIIFLGIISQISVLILLDLYIYYIESITHVGDLRYHFNPFWHEYPLRVNAILYWFILLEFVGLISYFLWKCLFSSSKIIRYISRFLTVAILGIILIYSYLLFSWLPVIYITALILSLWSWLYLLFAKEHKDKRNLVFLGISLQIVSAILLISFKFTLSGLSREESSSLLYLFIFLTSSVVFQLIYLTLRFFYQGIKGKKKNSEIKD